MGRKVKPPRLEPLYQGVFYIIDRRKQISTKTKNPVEAGLELSRYIQKKALDARAVQGDITSVTVAQIIKFYVEEHVNTGKVIDRQRIMKAIKAIEQINVVATGRPQRFVDLFLVELTREIFRQYGEQRGAGPGTIRYELTVLRSSLNHSVKEGRLKKSDVPYIEMPEPPKKKKRWLRMEEAKALLASCSGRTRLFIYIALGSCGRKDAIENLKWPQVDFRHRRIDLAPADHEETDKRRANMRMGEYMWELMRHEYGIRTSEFVLGSNSDIRPAFNTACDRAGLTDVTPHVLRHTAATWMAQDGCEPYEIAAALGDTVQTVLENYMHFSPEYLAKSSDTLNSRFVELNEQRQL